MDQMGHVPPSIQNEIDNLNFITHIFRVKHIFNLKWTCVSRRKKMYLVRICALKFYEIVFEMGCHAEITRTNALLFFFEWIDVYCIHIKFLFIFSLFFFFFVKSFTFLKWIFEFLLLINTWKNKIGLEKIVFIN